MGAPGKADKVKLPVFHPAEVARGWRILRQHLRLQIDINRRHISGTATFNFCAINTHCVKVSLNLRRCRVKACYVNGKTAAIHHISSLDDQQLLQNVSSLHTKHRLKDVEYSMKTRRTASYTHPELVIDIPATVSADIVEDLESIKKQNTNTNESNPLSAPTVTLDKLPFFNVVIQYEVLDSTAGAIYYGNPLAENHILDPVYMLTESRFGMARFWMPCLDTKDWYDKCLFDLDLATKSSDMVVASGELISTSLHLATDFPNGWDDPTTKVYRYRLLIPAFASEIMIAVGPFVALPDPTLSGTVTHFCLPGRARELVHTAPPLFALSLAFCRDYFGADPPTSSYKQLFVGSMGSNVNSSIAGAGGIVVHSGDLLHSKRCIDEAIEAREAIMTGLVMSYIGRFLRPKSTEDAWLIYGLEAHVSSLGLQAILGRNWYRFRIWDQTQILKDEDSCDLSHFDIDRIADSTMESVRRRSHVIIYMIEKRVGSDVMKRALRDIVAEGRNNTASSIKIVENVFDLMRQLPSFQNENKSKLFDTSPPRYERILKDFNGELGPQGSLGVVSSGFDEAIQGVNVGPFLKRIRAICGTDVRSMVRSWAASCGTPRMQVGYQYNPRKHSIELVVRQDGVLKENAYTGRRCLAFTGTVQVRVMEVEGVHDHTVEITEPLFSVELPCHSRRAKHKSAAQAEREFNENPARASPVLWVRFDPDDEWCKDCTFKQKEDSWMALLKGERDAMAQFEACRGLRGTKTDTYLMALMSTLKDNQVYWRVRAEAAVILATTEVGLDKLLDYFRATYTSAKGDEWDSLHPNNFSNLADYFVKRSIIRAIANSRVPGSRTTARPDGSVPVKAVKFLTFLLSGHDNKGNEFDDDHYIAEIVDSAASAATGCINDPAHSESGNNGVSSTIAIKEQLERSRLIEQMIPRRSEVVREALCSAISKIEAAIMTIRDQETKGSVTRSLVSHSYKGDPGLVRSIFQLSGRTYNMSTRITALKSLTQIYGGDLNALRWIMAYADCDSRGKNIIETRQALLDKEVDKAQKIDIDHSYVESSVFRCKVLDLIREAATSKHWYGSISPILDALRRDTQGAKDICIRLLRIAVADPDPRVQNSAKDLAKQAWGVGIPVCLLARTEYVEAKLNLRRGISQEAREIAELKTNSGGALPLIPESYDMGYQSQVVKPKGSRGSKSGKSSKHSKGRGSSHKSSSKPPVPKFSLRSVAVPPSQAASQQMTTNNTSTPATIDLDPPSTNLPKPLVKPQNKGAPSTKPLTSKPVTVHLKSKPVPSSSQINRLGLLRSVPVKPKITDVKFPWHPLDDEDVTFLEKAWREMKGGSSSQQKMEKRNDQDLSKASSSVIKLPREDREKHSSVEVKDRKDVRENGGEGESSSKKKKKRKREGEDGHKKKKKKKKHRSDGSHRDRHDRGEEERNGLDEDYGRSEGKGKMGKFKIKVSNGQVAQVPEPFE